MKRVLINLMIIINLIQDYCMVNKRALKVSADELAIYCKGEITAVNE